MVVAQIDAHIVKMNDIAHGRGKAALKIKATETLIKLWERRNKVLGLEQQAQKVEIKHEQVVRIYEGAPPDPVTIDAECIDITPRKEIGNESIN